MDKIINEPLVYFKNGSKFHSVWNGTDTNVGFADADTKNNAIIFVEDEHKIYTHGQAFGGSTTQVVVTPILNASTPNVEKIATISVDGLSKDIYARISGGGVTPTPSDYDDTDIRNAIDQLTNSIADTNSRLDNIHTLNEQDVKDTVNGMFGTWNEFKGTTKFETWGNEPTSDMQQWLRGMGFFTDTDGTWTELVLRVGQIGAQVNNLSEIMNEDGTIDYETLAAKLQLDILDDVNGLKTAVANLNTKWANVDENQEVLEWVISGFRSQANSGGSFAQVYAEKNSQTENSISALETSVSQNTTNIGNVTNAHSLLASRVDAAENGLAQVTLDVASVDGKISSAKTDMTSTIDSKIAGIYTDVDGKLNTAVAGIIATDKDKDISSSIIAKINANENKSQLQLSADQIYLDGNTTVAGALTADAILAKIMGTNILYIGDTNDSAGITKEGFFFARGNVSERLQELIDAGYTIQNAVLDLQDEYSNLKKNSISLYPSGKATVKGNDGLHHGVQGGILFYTTDANGQDDSTYTRGILQSKNARTEFQPGHMSVSLIKGLQDLNDDTVTWLLPYPTAELQVECNPGDTEGAYYTDNTSLILRTTRQASVNSETGDVTVSYDGGIPRVDQELNVYSPIAAFTTEIHPYGESIINGKLTVRNGYTLVPNQQITTEDNRPFGQIEAGNITSHGDIEAVSLKVTGGTDQQVLLANGTTKNISELGSGGYPESPSVTSLTASQYITALGYRLTNGTSNELLTANGGKIEVSSIQRLPEGLISYNPTIPGIEFGESTAKVTFTTNNSYIGINKPIRNTIGTSGVSEFIWQHPDGDENPALSFGLSDSQVPNIAITASGDYDLLTFDANGFVFNGDVTAKTKIKLYNSSNPGKPSTIENDGVYIRLNSGAGIKLGSDTNNATIFCDENGTTLTNNNEDQMFTFVGNVEIQDSLEVVNDVTVDGQTVHSSDRNLKNIISDITLTAQQVADAPAVNFTWKNDENNINHVGSIAQYWQVVMPEVVKETKKGLGLDYSTAALMSSITVAKELMALKEEIAQLKAQINELTSNN